MKFTLPNGIVVEDPDEETKQVLLAACRPPEIKIVRPVTTAAFAPTQVELPLKAPQKEVERKRPTFAEFGKLGFLGSHFQAKATMFVVALALKKHYPRTLGRSELSAGACTILNTMSSGFISDQNAYDAAIRLECVGIAVRRRAGSKARIRWMLAPDHQSLEQVDIRAEIDRIPDKHKVWLKRASIERAAGPQTPDRVTV